MAAIVLGDARCSLDFSGALCCEPACLLGNTTACGWVWRGRGEVAAAAPQVTCETSVLLEPCVCTTPIGAGGCNALLWWSGQGRAARPASMGDVAYLVVLHTMCHAPKVVLCEGCGPRGLAGGTLQPRRASNRVCEQQPCGADNLVTSTPTAAGPLRWSPHAWLGTLHSPLYTPCVPAAGTSHPTCGCVWCRWVLVVGLAVVTAWGRPPPAQCMLPPWGLGWLVSPAVGRCWW
jgi:hypothetical protein